MTRGLGKAWLWRTAYWDRVAPGRLGALALGSLPLLFFLPLEKVSVFGEETRGTAILIWLFSLSLAFVVRGGQDLENEANVWPYQKGYSLWELALEDWILDVGLFLVAAFWWASVGVLALQPLGPSSVNRWVGFFLFGASTATLAHSLTLCLSSLGVRRPSDLTILLALLSLLAPALLLKTPEWARVVVDLVLPPFRAAVELFGSLRIGGLEGAVGPLLHLLLATGAVLGFGLWRISGWRPRA